MGIGSILLTLGLATQSASELWSAGARLAAIDARRAEIAGSSEPDAARSELVNWLVTLRRYDGALGELERLDPEDPRRGPVLHGLGRYDDALLALDPSAPDQVLLVLDSLAALGRLGEWERAVEGCAALLGEEHTEVRVLRGELLARNGQHGQAAVSFRAALGREPQHRAALFGLGRALIADGDREAGLEVLAEHRRLTPLLDELDHAARGLDLAPLHGPNWAAVGDAQRALGRIEAAESSYARATALARPEELTPIALRAARLQWENRQSIERALATLESARRTVDDPRLSVRAADLLVAAERPAEALVHLEHALELRPGDAAIERRMRTVREHLARDGAPPKKPTEKSGP